jgi:hypothetical protein
MFQDMDCMGASCIFYVKVGELNHLERSQSQLVTVDKAGIGTQTLQHDMIVSVSFQYYPGDFLRQTSADILLLEERPFYMEQTSDFGSRTLQFISINKPKPSD